MNAFLTYLKENQQMIPIYTGILGFIGVMLSSILKSIFDFFINKKKIKSEVVSKSRVEWIQDFRKIMSEFITLGGEFSDLHSQLTNSQNTYLENKILIEFRSKFLEMQEKKNLLLLYLPQTSYKRNKKVKNEDHIILIDIMNELSHRINLLSYDINSQKLNSTLMYYRRQNVVNSLSELTYYSSEYLKQEWEKAKTIK